MSESSLKRCLHTDGNDAKERRTLVIQGRGRSARQYH